MKRIYHHVDNLEEGPMWQKITGQLAVEFTEKAAELMKEPDCFKDAMRQALEKWPFACEHNLSAKNINRLAWLGHAGCYLETGSPEECTRLGWWKLDQDQQDEANAVAAEVIEEWENAQTKAR